MPQSIELLDVARLLSTAGAQTRSTEAELRRAISSVYYAVFHSILHAASERFMGPGHGQTAAYGILYRSFEHAHMRAISEALQVPTLRDKFKRQLR